MTNLQLLARNLALAGAVAIAMPAGAAAKKPKEHPAPVTASVDQGTDPLESVLHTMDQTAATFRSAQADFVWTTYNAVIKEVDGTDKGKIYFRRSGKEIEMAADMAPPDEQQIVFSGGKIKVYRAQTKQVNVYDAGAHREEFETLLVLGFGSSGSDMRKSFEVKYLGTEKIGDAETARLQLTPRRPRCNSSSRVLIFGSICSAVCRCGSSSGRPMATTVWLTIPIFSSIRRSPTTCLSSERQATLPS